MVNARIILGRLQFDGIPARLQYEVIGVISIFLFRRFWRSKYLRS